MDNRNHMGKNKDGVILPVAPNLSEMSDAYLRIIEEVKSEIQKQRISVVLNANSSMICLYWNIGKSILKKQVVEHGGKVVVVGYLGGVLFPLYFQFFGEELVGKCSPVDLRVSHVVGVEVPGGTSEFTGTSYFFQ